MTKNEKKILLGLYISNQMVDRGIIYFTHEINWLIQNKLSQAKNWRNQNGKFKNAGGELDENGDNLGKYASIQSKVVEALSYLEGKHYIKHEKHDISSFKISITIDGCDIARELQTRVGRLNLWYKVHKDGILWFLVTILTSLVVALITTLLSK